MWGGGGEGEKGAGSEGCFQKADDNKVIMIVTICVVRLELMLLMLHAVFTWFTVLRCIPLVYCIANV